MKNYLSNWDIKNLDYFFDRDKIGLVLEDINEIKDNIKKISLIEKTIKPLNDNLESKMTYLGNAKSRIFEIIKGFDS